MFKVKTIKEIDYIELDRFLDESDKTQEELRQLTQYVEACEPHNGEYLYLPGADRTEYKQLRQLLAGFFPNESLDNVRIYYWW